MSFLLFLGSGLFSTLLDLAIFSSLIHVLSKSVAYATSYSICVACRYLIDSRVTFANTGRGRFLHYFAGNLLAMAVGLGVFQLLALYLAPVPAKLLSIPPTTLAGYVLMKYVVFRTRSETANDAEPDL